MESCQASTVDAGVIRMHQVKPAVRYQIIELQPGVVFSALVGVLQAAMGVRTPRAGPETVSASPVQLNLIFADGPL